MIDCERVLGQVRPEVLVLMGIAWPGREASGPLISLRMIEERLSDQFEFVVVSRDRPRGGGKNTKIVEEQSTGRFFLRPTRFGARGLLKVLRSRAWNLYYFNSFFDPQFSIAPLLWIRAGLVPPGPILVAPRGELSPGALSIKTARKKLFVAAVRKSGLLSQTWLQATSNLERDEIAAILPEISERIIVAPNLRSLPLAPARPAPSDRLRVVFLSRIDPKKNLDFAIETLMRVKAPTTFDIYGPISAPEYAASCEALLKRLPAQIAARMMGPIPNKDVVPTLATYDLFFLPTRGENFGHSIFDALAAGVPILVSDRTPWRDLERLAGGWDIPLDAGAERFAQVIENLATTSPDNRLRLRVGARALAGRYVNESNAQETSRMFRTVMSSC